MKVVLSIQTVSTSNGTVFYASDDGEVVLSLQGVLASRPRFECIEVNIPFVDEERV